MRASVFCFDLNKERMKISNRCFSFFAHGNEMQNCAQQQPNFIYRNRTSRKKLRTTDDPFVTRHPPGIPLLLGSQSKDRALTFYNAIQIIKLNYALLYYGICFGLYNWLENHKWIINKRFWTQWTITKNWKLIKLLLEWMAEKQFCIGRVIADQV